MTHERPRLSDAERAWYQRQLGLPELGEAGQSRLRAARVLVVGAGGLGCPALQALAMAGVGFLRICEPDAVEIHNLHRQPFYTADQLGQPKGRLARQRLQEMNPALQAEWEPRPFSHHHAREMLAGMDLVLDCGDSLDLSFTLNAACLEVGLPLVAAAVHRWEGQVWTVRPNSPGGCLRCLWPVQPDEAASCAGSGILGAVTGLIGSWQALEALRLLLGMPDTLESALLVLDAREAGLRRIRRSRREACPVCGTAQALSHHPWAGDKDAVEVVTRDRELKDWRHATVLDLRELGEPGRPIPEGLRVLHRPLSGLRFPEHGLPLDDDVLVVCAHGVRSLWVVSRLRALGFSRCWSLKGGMEG